jgi:membrane associated rhomboid family serine protease
VLTNKQLNFSQELSVILTAVALLTVIEIINLLTGRVFNQYGNLPREVSALPGIFIGPFLHGSLTHFFSNIIPFAIFLYLLLQHGVKRSVGITLWVIVVTGILVWLFGRDAYHVGASGVLYGYFGYLVLGGFFSRQMKLIFISLLVGFFYGGLIFGVLPARPYISWESHLFGFISGSIAAYFWAKKKTTHSS